MVVLVATSVKPGFRGELSKWMLEPHAGVFVGNLSARIRERLWEKIEREVTEGSAVMIYTSRSEQGFQVRSHGDRTRIPEDFEGLTLIRQRIERSSKTAP